MCDKVCFGVSFNFERQFCDTKHVQQTCQILFQRQDQASRCRLLLYLASEFIVVMVNWITLHQLQ